MSVLCKSKKDKVKGKESCFLLYRSSFHCKTNFKYMAVDNKYTFYFIRVVWHVTVNITNRLKKFGRLSDDYKRD